MTQKVLCLNAAGATDRLTLGVYYRVLRVWHVASGGGGFVEVVDDRGECTVFWAPRFTPLAARAKEGVTHERSTRRV